MIIYVCFNVDVYLCFRSYTGSMSNKDRRPGMSTSMGTGQEMFNMSAGRMVPDLDMSADSMGYVQLKIIQL